jgi:hypothetical protein
MGLCGSCLENMLLGRSPADDEDAQVSFFWPKKVAYTDLQGICERSWFGRLSSGRS